jgi:hypothetical protein
VIVVAVVGDLILASRIEAIAVQSGAAFSRIDHPGQLPAADGTVLAVVDWAERGDGWGEALHAWRRSDTGARLLVVGPHLDADGHAEAKRLGIGPVRARSALERQLKGLLTERTTGSRS